MTLILCVDKNFGLMFNKRRQSRDSIVIEDIIKNLQGEPLFVSEYTAKLFDSAPFTLCQDFTDIEGICFVEDKYDNSLLEKAEKVIIYNWGRAYPGDVTMNVAYLKSNFTLNEVATMAGTSHNEIIKEIYLK